MSKDLKDILPATSFVPFDCQAVSQPEILWANSDPAMAIDLKAHAYCIPMKDDPGSTYGAGSKTYYAERYGGAGVAGNAGGARCGVSDGVQIKGIGPTPVVGGRADYWHSHGAASMLEGLRGAIWGEVCHAVLPYGGTRIHGVVATGTDCLFQAPEGATNGKRVLIMREPALRPAHYMRSIYFDPNKQFSETCVSDAVRTKEAIRNIQRGFEAMFGKSSGLLVNCINDGLQKMVQQIAHQVAVAKVKRIMHGSLASSNICMDGAWIDFGTISALSDYGRIIIARGCPDFREGHMMLKQTMSRLHFYLTKYLSPEMSRGLVNVDWLVQQLDVNVDNYLERECLRLVGIPVSVYPDIVLPEESRRLLQCFRAIVRPGNSEPFKLAPDSVAEMPEKMGKYSLNTLLSRVGMCAKLNDMDAAIEDVLDDAILRNHFVRTVWEVRESFLERIPGSGNGDSGEFIRAYVMFNALRMNCRCVDLYQPELHRVIMALPSDRTTIESFMSKTIGKAISLLEDADGKELDVSGLMDYKNEGRHILSQHTFSKTWLHEATNHLNASLFDSAGRSFHNKEKVLPNAV